MCPLWERAEDTIKNIRICIVELFKSGMSLAEHRLRIWHCKINN